MAKDTVTLQRSIAGPETLREIDAVEIRQQETQQREAHWFTLSAGGVSYRAETREQLAEIVKAIKSHRIQFQGSGWIDVFERIGWP